MKSRAMFVGCFAILFAFSFLAGCGGGGGTSITVAISPSSTQTIDESQTVSFTATVSGDSSNAGVSWSVSGGGTLTNTSTTAATYNAPASVTSEVTATVTATSVTDSTKSASAMVKVVVPPSISTTSLPNGTNGETYNSQISASGGIGTLTFSISSGSLPAGLSLSSSGAISGRPSSHGTSSFTVKVTDSATPPLTATANLSLTINLPPPLVITTTSPLPGATTGLAYSEQIMTSGGVAPVTFSLAAGNSLPDGLSLSSDGLISGTPTGAGTFTFTIVATDSAIPPQTASMLFSLTITPQALMFLTTSLPDGYVGVPYSQQVMVTGGVPPYTFSLLSGGLPDGLTLDAATGIISGTPTGVEQTSFMINVLDSQMPQHHASEQLKLNTDSAGTAFLNGQYAFQMSGFDGNGNPVAFIGTFTADGMGNVTGGAEDINLGGTVTTNLTVTGTFVVGMDYRGQLMLTLGDGSTQLLAFAMDLQGTHANLIDFDNVDFASGTFQKQDATAFSSSSLAGDYAYGLFTNFAAATRSVQIGRFTLDSAGALSDGTGDTDNQGSLMTNLSIAGSFGAPDSSTGRGTASLTPQNQSTLNFVYYIVQQGEIFAMETDAGAGVSVYNGCIQSQQGAGSFTTNSLNGPSIFSASGVDTGGASLIAGQFSGDPTTLLVSGEIDLQDAGLVQSALQFTQGTYSVSQNGRGTMSFVNSQSQDYFDAIFYLTGQNTGFLMDASTSGNYIRFGTFVPQTGGPFSGAPNDGTYFGGSPAPATAGPLPSGTAVAVPNINTVMGLSSGTLTGVVDLADLNFAPTSKPITGTYTFGDSFGRATINVNSVGFGSGDATIYLITPTQGVMITTLPFAQNANLAVFQTQ